MASKQILHDAGCNNLHQLARLNLLAKSVYKANSSNTSVNIMDITNSEVQIFLKSLHKNDVKYMLVGGIATVFHGHIRTTQDLDLWVQETLENKQRLVQALKEIGVFGAESYLDIEMIPGWSSITIGDKGFVADFMGYMKAFKKEDFDNCYERAKKGNFEGTPITVIHINDLIKEKRQLGRAKDIDDVENLEKIKNQK